VAERSIRKRAMNPKKLHGVDWTLGYPRVPEPFINVGHKLESAIYLHWRRQREDLGYIGGEREIDLVVNPERSELLVKVATHIDRPEIYDREIGGATVGSRADAACETHTDSARAPGAGCA